MSLGSSRYQDLTRQEAYGLEARVLIRMAPLLEVRADADCGTVASYLKAYFEFTRTLADISLGNISSEEAILRGKRYHESLRDPRVFEQKSELAVDSVQLVTDALGELNLVRYIPKGGLRESDLTNPDVEMLVVHGAEVLARIGMVRDVFIGPAKLDCGFILENRTEGDPLVTPALFARPLWPEPYLPFALKHVIIEDWLERLKQLRLSGLADRYAQDLDGMHLTRKFNRESLLAGFETPNRAKTAIILTAIEVEMQAVLRHITAQAKVTVAGNRLSDRQVRRLEDSSC